MLRFALLRHECPPDYRDGPHWDLMLERPGVVAEHRLATWSLQQLPTAWGRASGEVGETSGIRQDTVPAEALSDHRAVYLDYEGAIAGDRGTVARVASGTVEWIELTADTVRARLSGSKALAGEIALIRSTSGVWQLSFTWQPVERTDGFEGRQETGES